MDHPAIDPLTVLIVAAEGSAAANAAEIAVTASGGRALRPVGWSSLSPATAPARDPSIILAEAADATGDALDTGLAILAELAATLDVPLVVALREDQIDAVAAHVLTRVELLCAPTVADRVAAISVLGRLGSAALVTDRLAENEAARLARLNEEVARIAEVLTRLSRRDRGAAPEGLHAPLADRRATFGAEPAAPADVAAGDIRAAIRSRRLRDRMFGPGWFEDPAWDILLDLFAAELERAQVSVSSLCIAAAVAPTTGLRWIGKLTDAGLLEREADPFDRRRAFMRLSQRARDGMFGYCAEVRAQGLSIA